MESPCIDVCRFEEESGCCLGCGMTKREKKRWKKEKEAREAITEALEGRLAALRARGFATGKAAKRKRR